jgi:hypothetical protein
MAADQLPTIRVLQTSDLGIPGTEEAGLPVRNAGLLFCSKVEQRFVQPHVPEATEGL